MPGCRARARDRAGPLAAGRQAGHGARPLAPGCWRGREAGRGAAAAMTRPPAVVAAAGSLLPPLPTSRQAPQECAARRRRGRDGCAVMCAAAESEETEVFPCSSFGPRFIFS